MADKAIGVIGLTVGLTALAVVLSKRSNTASVLTAFLNGWSNVLKSAAQPIR